MAYRKLKTYQQIPQVSALETRVENARRAALAAGKVPISYVFIPDDRGFFRVRAISEQDLLDDLE